MSLTQSAGMLVPCRGCGQQIAISQIAGKSQVDGYICIDCYNLRADIPKPTTLADLIEEWEATHRETEALSEPYRKARDRESELLERIDNLIHGINGVVVHNGKCCYINSAMRTIDKREIIDAKSYRVGVEPEG